MELTPFVQEKLLPGHKLNTVVEAGFVEDILKTSRIVALIEATDPGGGDTLQALLIYQSARVPVHNSFDLKLELVIPVDTNLKCEIDTSGQRVGTEVVVYLTSRKVRLQLEMPFSQQTNTFVSDVLRAAEALSKKGSAACDFSWLKPYSDSVTDGHGEVKSDGSNKGSFHNFNTISEEVIDLDITSLDNETNISNEYASNYATGATNRLGEKENCDLPSARLNPTVRKLSMPMFPHRESQIKSKMALKEETYTNIHNYTVFVGTWNVNGQYPSVGLAEWLACDEDPPDVYSIAFQELDLNKEAFLFNVTSREQEWLNAVFNSVHPKGKYKKVRLVRLVGMMLIVLVQDKHLAYIRNVAMDTVGTGIMNKWGNKGAVSIRLDLHNTSICFVNSHMAAHVEEYERRNDDHDCIFSRTAFNINITGPAKGIKDHDHIYFLGDMNYRINAGNFDIRQLATKGDLELLLENDQLNQQKSIGRIFRKFKEGSINFKPTFKYDLYSDNWDSSEKARQPAWCDRILWQGEGIAQKRYRSHPSLQISDHKPVSAVFEAGIKVIDATRYRKIYEEVMKEMDKEENEALPQVGVDTTEIVFDTVMFQQSQIQYLTVANTGQVAVQFSFINKLNESSPCKPWLTINPLANVIMPGRKCDVSLEVSVGKQTAHRLNTGSEKLYDILVLHLEGGKDIFITVNADYERSCFGSSINALVYMSKPFKDIPISELIDLESKNPKHLPDQVPYAVPKELWYLVDHIIYHGRREEGLFTTPGKHKDHMAIRAALDAGIPDKSLPGEIHAAAEILLLFLEALPEPVIPYALYEKALEATPNFSLCREVIDELPVHHRNVFTYLMNFLKELLKFKEVNGLDEKILAHVFGSILIRSPEVTAPSGVKATSAAVERKKFTFVNHFFLNEEN